MKFHVNRRTVIAGGAWLAGATVLNVRAQAYPDKQVRLVIPSVPGGGTDAIGRAIADSLGAMWKQTVIPDNKPGAGGVVASQIVARAPADGYTLLLVVPGHTLNPALVKSLPYDTINDFAAVTSIAKTPYTLVASATTGVKTVADLRAFARRSPADLSFGHGEAGGRFSAEKLAGILGVPVTHVSYKGTGPMMTDIAGGHLRFSMTSIASALPFRGTPAVNFVAVAGSTRAPAVPEVPTFAEQGIPGFQSTIWYGIVAPQGTPKALVNQVVAAIRTAMGTEDVKKRLNTLAMESWVTSSEEFDAFMREDLASNLKLAKQSGLEPQ